MTSELTRNLSLHGQASGKSGANFRRYIYTYNMLAAQTPIQFYITCVPLVVWYVQDSDLLSSVGWNHTMANRQLANISSGYP